MVRSEEHTSELQSRQYLHSFPTRRSSDLVCAFANEFDKLTSIRPGFPQLSPAEAFRRIAGLDGEPPLPIYDPAFHKPLIDKFLAKSEPLSDAQPEKVQAENIPNLVEGGGQKTKPASETIDYGKIKHRH